MSSFTRFAAIAMSASQILMNAQPPSSTPCDQAVVDKIAVNGLDPSVLKFPVSSLTIPTLGFATEDMAKVIDPLVANYMNQNGSAGGTVTMTYNNQLIFAKSYGYADLANKLFAQPDSRLRIASVTKAFTAMGILKLFHDNELLVESGSQWPLNTQPFNPPGFGAPIGGARQTWIEPATVTDLLYHEGGWDEDYENYDNLMAVETTLGTAGPPDCQTLLRYVESRSMTTDDFTPGNGQIYSNVGYCALGETIRQLSGAASYLDYMQTNVFTPLGMNDTLLGSSKQADQLDREAVYYPCGYLAGRTPPVTPIPCDYGTPPIEGKSLFPPHNTVSAAYGGGVHTFSLQASEGAGGFVSTSIDLARFSGAIASGQLPNFPGGALHPGWPQSFYTYSAGQSAYEIANGLNDFYYGMGWNWVQPNPVTIPFLSYDNYNLEKIGQLPGTSSSITTTGDGYSFSGIFNGDWGQDTVAPAEGIFWGPTGALQAAYNHASAQPWNVDFFPEYGQDYTAWMSAGDFASYLTTQESNGFYPSRLEGRVAPGPSSFSPLTIQYRARFSSQKLTPSATAPQMLYGASCSTVLSALEAAPASTPLVSLQVFVNPYSFFPVYQAVWSAPIPPLPAN
jgi:CubicO group peptidase (beta-lactamase class C family)